MTLESQITIDDTEKIAILKSLMESSRSQIMFWHDRAYIAAVGSFGVLLTITKLWIDSLKITNDTQSTIDPINKIVSAHQSTEKIINEIIPALGNAIDASKLMLFFCCITALILTECFTQIYLRAVINNYDDNEKVKLKCEYALQLKAEGAYVSVKNSPENNYKFFWAPNNNEEDKGMPAKDICALRIAHIIFALILVIGCTISLFVNYPGVLSQLVILPFLAFSFIGFIVGVTLTVMVYKSR